MHFWQPSTSKRPPALRQRACLDAEQSRPGFEKPFDVASSPLPRRRAAVGAVGAVLRAARRGAERVAFGAAARFGCAAAAEAAAAGRGVLPSALGFVRRLAPCRCAILYTDDSPTSKRRAISGTAVCVSLYNRVSSSSCSSESLRSGDRPRRRGSAVASPLAVLGPFEATVGSVVTGTVITSSSSPSVSSSSASRTATAGSGPQKSQRR